MRGKNWLAVLVRVVCLVILMVACVAEVYGSSTGIQSQTPKKSQSDLILIKTTQTSHRNF